MQVLIAEDNALYRTMISQQIAGWGYIVKEAEDGSQAWEILQLEDAPRLVILDWQMPGMDGIDVCRRIKQNSDFPFTYIMMLSGRDSDEDMVAGLEAGADEYLTKPIEPAVLKSRLKAARRILENIPTDDSRKPIVNGFEIRDTVGRGAYAAVWDATFIKTGKRVALKIVNFQTAPPHASQRFQREIELLAKLREHSHPNIAKMYDSRIDRHRGLCAMQFVEGVTIDKYIIQQNPSPRKILRIVSKICSALEHAHKLGILHRDLKPSNIMVTDNDEPKLVDFGLGKSIFHESGHDSQEAELTMDGMAVGTPMFMAPEQARGEHDEIDQRSDLYSLGVVLYVLLLRRHPHNVSEEDPWATLMTVGTADAKAPSDVMPGFNADLEKVVMKAIAREKALRYQTATEFKSAIDNFLEKRK